MSSPNYITRTEMAKFYLAPGTKRWLLSMEEGSYEDHDRDPGHVYAILTRFPLTVEIRNTEEARTLLRSVEYFAEDSGFDSWRPIFGRCLAKLARQVRILFPDA